MTTYGRTDRVVSLLRKLAAVFIRDEANASPLITVTTLEVTRDLSHATVFVSVFPTEQEAQALIFLKRKRGEFRSFVKEKVHLKDIPRFDFVIDLSEKNRLLLEKVTRTETQPITDKK